jgi:hypothetical protein
MKNFLLLLFVLLCNLFYAQAVIFSENMGSPTGTTAIASHVFENNAPVNFAGTADVRSTLPSTYTNASASGNVNFANTIGRYLVISGINTTNYSNIVLSFGHYKSTAASSNELKVEVSSDSVSWTQLTYTRPTGAGTSVWVLVTASGTIPSTSNLRIRYTQTSGVASFRIDDIKLVGDLPAGFPLITNILSKSTSRNVPFSDTIKTSNTATKYQAFNLPSGLAIDTNTGVISGVPSIPGNYNITLTASNSVGTDSRVYKLKVTCVSNVSISPLSGPFGTVITIVPDSASVFDMMNANANLGTPLLKKIESTSSFLKAQIPLDAKTGGIIVSNGICVSNPVSFTITNSDTTNCEVLTSTITYSDIFISELFDEEIGSDGFVEIYNPTSSPVNLNQYTLKRYANIGDALPSDTKILSGTLASNQTVLVGTGEICGLLPTISFGNGFNQNDEFRLEKSSVVIDVVQTPIDLPGYNLKRRNNVQAPSTTFLASDWLNDDSESCLEHDLGSYPLVIANAPFISQEPKLVYTCEMNQFSLKVKAQEAKVGGNPLAYQWFKLDSGSNAWTALSNGADFEGATSDSLVVKNLGSKFGAQYFVQVRENTASCFRNSMANYLNRNAMITKPILLSTLSNQNLCSGSANLRLKILASGANFYRWYKNDTFIVGNSTDSFIKLNIGFSDTGVYKIVALKSITCADSSSAKITFLSPLAITSAPASTIIVAGNNYSLSVTAPGATSYQWKRNGLAISGATSSVLNINNAVIANDTGCYKVICYRTAPCADSIESACANLTVSGSGPCPSIISQPKDTIKICTNDSFRISVTGQDYLALQWYKNGVPISGATSTSYFVASALSTDTGVYNVELITLNSSSCPSLFSSNSIVKIATSPILTAQPQKSFYCEPDSHRLVVVGSNYANVIWYKNNVVEPTLNGADVLVRNITESNDIYVAELMGMNECPSVKTNPVRIIKRPPNKYAYLAPNSIFDMTEQCIDKEGFVYYTKDKEDQFLFGIRSGDTSVGFSPDIELLPSNISILPSSNNFNQGFIYGTRLFNVDLTKNKLKYSYDVRFLYNDTDSSSIMDIFLKLKQIYGNQMLPYNKDLLAITSTLVPFTSNLLNNVLNFNATISSINSIGRLNGISYIDINKLVANNGGGTLIMMYQLNQNSRIIENNSGNTIALYPNPASDFVTIKIPKMMLPVDIAIMDIFGKMLYESLSNRVSSSEDFKIDLNEIANGNYIVKIQIQGSEPIYKKLVIRK